ncbi:MAG: hypothetical protein JXQ25_04195 [Deltaproteobacteria bacterium]|nr:hypothetical protein [Deltaproteobacteria bacterium]
MYSRHFSLIIIAALFLCAGTVYSADVTITPSISLRGEYDDNIDFSRTNKLDDYAGTVSPALSFDYITDRFTMQGRTLFGIVRYADYNEYDRENQNHGLNLGYRLSERLNANANASYIRDTTLDTALEETGLVERRSERENIRAGGGLAYEINEVSNVGLDYFFTTTDYELATYTDSDTHGLSMSYNYAFNNRLDTVTLVSSYQKTDSDEDKTDNYSSSLGLAHTFGPTLQANVSAGVRYLDIEDPSGDSETDWGWTSNISLQKSWQTTSATLGYSRDLSYSAEGETIEVDRFSLSADHSVTREFGLRLTGSLYFTKSAGDVETENSRYYSISPLAYYNITQHHSVELGYNYSREANRLSYDNTDIDRNIVWLALNFNFPQKW